MSAIIRPATEADIPRLVQLYDDLAITEAPIEKGKQVSPDEYREVFSRIAADPNHHLLILEADGKVVATLVYILVPNLSHRACPWAIIENVIVDKEYRRWGLGRVLMDYALARSREAGCFRVQLCSSVQRAEAHLFYRSLGFEPSAYGFRLYF